MVFDYVFSLIILSLVFTALVVAWYFFRNWKRTAEGCCAGRTTSCFTGALAFGFLLLSAALFAGAFYIWKRDGYEFQTVALAPVSGLRSPEEANKLPISPVSGLRLPDEANKPPLNKVSDQAMEANNQPLVKLTPDQEAQKPVTVSVGRDQEIRRHDSNIVTAESVLEKHVVADNDISKLNFAKPCKPATCDGGAANRIELKPSAGNATFLGDICVGGLQVKALYDTGSMDSIILSESCSDCKRVMAKRDWFIKEKCKEFPDYFLCKKYEIDSMYRPTPSTVDLVKDKLKWRDNHYGSGDITVLQTKDTIQIGCQKVEHASFGQYLTATDSIFAQDNYFSVIGLGKEDKDFRQEESAFLSRADIKRFSFCLRRNADKPGGYFEIDGPTDSSAVKVPVVGKTHWGVEVGKLAFANAVSCNQAGEKKCAAIIDSGTSYLHFPNNFVMDMHRAVKQDCSNYEKLPDIVFTIADQTYNIPKEQYVKMSEKPTGKQCDVMIFPSNFETEEYSVFLLGIPFLHEYKTTFIRATDGNKGFLEFARVDENCNVMSFFGSGKAVEASEINLFANDDKVGQEDSGRQPEGDSGREPVGDYRDRKLPFILCGACVAWLFAWAAAVHWYYSRQVEPSVV